MISDERRREIMGYVSSLDKAGEYLDMIERTIIHIHRREDMGPDKARALKLIRDILQGVVESLNEKVMDFADDLKRFADTKKRAQDYWRQVEEPPADIHTHQVLVPGAELVLEEEESHEYKIVDQSNNGRMIALEVETEEEPS